MSEYRTVTVTAQLISDTLSVTPTLTELAVDQDITDRIVTVEAELTDSIIEVTPDLSGTITVDAELVTTVYSSGDYDFYTGETEFTPSTETQTASTSGKVVLSNIIINPIPSNYGLITWDGSVLTVS